MHQYGSVTHRLRNVSNRKEYENWELLFRLLLTGENSVCVLLKTIMPRDSSRRHFSVAWKPFLVDLVSITI
jgi:hypothetical protein